MKNIIILLVATITLTSCTSSESEENNSDPILGTWYAFSEDGFEVNDCEKNRKVVFKEDFTVTSEDYYEEEIDGTITCTKEDEIFNQNWSVSDDNIYTITSNEEDENDQEAIITFSDNNNTFTLVDTSDGYTAVYKK